MHKDDARQWCAEEFPVAQHRDSSGLRVMAGDAHGSVDRGAELASQMREGLGQLGHLRWRGMGFLE